LKILVCVKRVPMVGGQIVLTADGRSVDTTMTGFTVSPHEECAVEEALRIAGRSGGSPPGQQGEVTVLTLGPAEAEQQLRDMLALGATRAVLLRTDGSEWGPVATAAAIADAVRDEGYDLLLFGNESADTGGYQVPIRVAHALGLPVVTGIKHLVVAEGGGEIAATREDETFRLPLPAVVSVKEGINLPRYPSLPGRLRAKRAQIDTAPPRARPELDRLRMERLRVPPASGRRARVLGHGAEAVPVLVGVLDDLGLLP
jgi:electron transfer flavoprotein beta subunit